MLIAFERQFARTSTHPVVHLDAQAQLARECRRYRRAFINSTWIAACMTCAAIGGWLAYWLS